VIYNGSALDRCSDYTPSLQNSSHGDSESNDDLPMLNSSQEIIYGSSDEVKSSEVAGTLSHTSTSPVIFLSSNVTYAKLENLVYFQKYVVQVRNLIKLVANALLKIPPTETATAARACRGPAPKFWNNLPMIANITTSFHQFNRLLKGHLFKQ